MRSEALRKVFRSHSELLHEMLHLVVGLSHVRSSPGELKQAKNLSRKILDSQWGGSTPHEPVPHTATRGFDREGPHKEDPRKQDPNHP